MNTSLQHSNPALTPEPIFTDVQRPRKNPAINGIALLDNGEHPDPQALRERAYGELLRQECVRLGLLPDRATSMAPKLGEHDQQVIANLLDEVVASPLPSDEECRRYFDARTSQFVRGQALRLRHILFAVTPGVDVQALARRAELALAQLKSGDDGLLQFASLARDLSNCPSAAEGGELGWIEPSACTPELAAAFFHQERGMMPARLQPRLIHSRFGLHIIEVLEQRAGTLPDYDKVQQRIAAQLQLQSRARALHQYMVLLAGRSQLTDLDLETTNSPLLQ